MLQVLEPHYMISESNKQVLILIRHKMTIQKEYTESLRRIYDVIEAEAIRHQALNLDGKEELVLMLEDFAGQHDFHFSYCPECGAINKQTINGDCGPCLNEEHQYRQYMDSIESNYRQAKGW